MYFFCILQVLICDFTQVSSFDAIPSSSSLLESLVPTTGYSTCLSGKYVAAAGTGTTDVVCSPCPAGSYCTGGSASPLPCGSVTRFSTGGNSSCALVDVGFYTLPVNGTNTTNQTGQTACAIGAYCSGGIMKTCTAGTFQNLTQQSSCRSCSTCKSGLNVTAVCSSTNDTACKGGWRLVTCFDVRHLLACPTPHLDCIHDSFFIWTPRIAA